MRRSALKPMAGSISFQDGGFAKPPFRVSTRATLQTVLSLTVTEFDLLTYLPSALALLFTGAIAGVLAGLLGVGGGIVIVPVLFNLFGVLALPAESAMHVAVGTSLATIIPTSIASMRSHLKRGSVDKGLLKAWATPVFIGSALGALISAQVAGVVLTTVFAVVATLVALNMVSKEGLKVADSLPITRWANSAIAFVIGTFSAMMGIGGGTLSVPTLSAFNFDIRKAVGTASAIGLAISIPGMIGFVIAGWDNPNLPPFSIGYVNIIGFFLIFPMTVMTAPIGARIAHTINRVWLRRAFALFLGVTAVRMFLKLLGT